MVNQKVFFITAELDDHGKVSNKSDFQEHLEDCLKNEWVIKSHTSVLYGNRLVNTFVAEKIHTQHTLFEETFEQTKENGEEKKEIDKEEANKKVLKGMGIIE